MTPREPRRGLAAPLAFALLGCGYHPLYGATSFERERYALVAAPIHAADPEAALAAEAGARTELAREGALADCAPASDASCPSILVELLRVDTSTSGVAAVDGAPLGLGVRATARGRATIFERGKRDTTEDVEASEYVGASPSAAADIVSTREAARRAARRLGERLVRRALRIPEPAAD